MDLLAPGAPAASPPRRPAPPPAPPTLPVAMAPPALPVATSAGPAPRSATVPGSSSAAPLRVGSRFQPMPGPLPIATGDRAPGSGLVLVAPAGTPVHAVEAGTVTLPAHAGEPLRLVADSGLTFSYGGVAAGSVAVSDGTRVAAGAILGAVAAAKLVLHIVDGSGADVDVPGFLVGLPDPNELGHAAVGTGVDVDPDALDQEIARASSAADQRWGGAP